MKRSIITTMKAIYSLDKAIDSDSNRLTVSLTQAACKKYITFVI
jgi:hypothetical protein